MYKQMAAYAIAIIRNERSFIPAIIDGSPVWGVDKGGKYIYSNLAYADRLSILGAMRAAQEEFDGSGSRAYNTLDRYVRHYAQDVYRKSATELDHVECLEVFRIVAKQ